MIYGRLLRPGGPSDVTATGLSCAEAEWFVQVAGEQTSSVYGVALAGVEAGLLEGDADPAAGGVGIAAPSPPQPVLVDGLLATLAPLLS